MFLFMFGVRLSYHNKWLAVKLETVIRKSESIMGTGSKASMGDWKKAESGLTYEYFILHEYSSL